MDSARAEEPIIPICAPNIDITFLREVGIWKCRSIGKPSGLGTLVAIQLDEDNVVRKIIVVVDVAEGFHPSSRAYGCVQEIMNSGSWVVGHGNHCTGFLAEESRSLAFAANIPLDPRFTLPLTQRHDP